MNKGDAFSKIYCAVVIARWEKVCLFLCDILFIRYYKAF